MQEGLVPRQAPDQRRNRQPLAGVALSWSGTYDGNEAEQRGRQLMPARELRTEPRPDTPTVSGKTAGAKNADTVVPCATATLHRNAPSHPPVQLTSLAPARGTAVKSSRVEAFQVVVQLWLHRRPGTSASTAPGPEIVSAKGTCRSSCTSQGESCVSKNPDECP